MKFGEQWSRREMMKALGTGLGWGRDNNSR